MITPNHSPKSGVPLRLLAISSPGKGQERKTKKKASLRGLIVEFLHSFLIVSFRFTLWAKCVWALHSSWIGCGPNGERFRPGRARSRARARAEPVLKMGWQQQIINLNFNKLFCCYKTGPRRDSSFGAGLGQLEWPLPLHCAHRFHSLLNGQMSRSQWLLSCVNFIQQKYSA